MNDTFTSRDRENLATLAANLLSLREQFTALVLRLQNDETSARLDERVRNLENFRYYLLGGAGAVGAVSGFVIFMVMKVLTQH